ncbi:GGDEF domain-containing protein [Myxococcota bacterium]|nr:GGDEF domain-containing protein [Myxococcota bacterium]MBU1535431.1 GGDEF domain-containing protein [Myxococcota bacterium]
MAPKSDFSRGLLILMVSIGIIMGIVFPFFNVLVLDVPSAKILTPTFFSLCIAAGLVVGLLNYFVFKFLIYNFLQQMDSKLKLFKRKVGEVKKSGTIECDSAECFIKVNTGDAIIGNIGNSFNEFITFIVQNINTEILTNNFLEHLKESLNIKDISGVVIDSFIQYFKADGGTLMGYEHGEFHVIKSVGMEIKLEDLNLGELEKILENQKSVVYKNLENDPLQLNIVVGSIKPSAIAFIPLKYQENNIGVCILLSRKPFERDFNQMESRNFVNQATPFLYNRTLIKRLERFAAIDELTGVYNRRFGVKRLNEEFERARRHGSALSICMIDVDHFKKLNDTFGHQAGDYVLKELAAILEKEIRISDFILRYGGEEFLLVLPGASLHDAHRKMDRLREQVAATDFHFGTYTLKSAFSGGVFSYPCKDVSDIDEMIALADLALYKAKKGGRNRIVVAETAMTMEGLTEPAH